MEVQLARDTTMSIDGRSPLVSLVVVSAVAPIELPGELGSPGYFLAIASGLILGAWS